MKTFTAIALLMFAGCQAPAPLKPAPGDIAGMVREFSAKGSPTESDLAAFNELAKADRGHLLRSLVSLAGRTTDYNQSDVIAGLIAYYDFTVQELDAARRASDTREADAYRALIRETENGSLAIRRQEVIRILRQNNTARKLNDAPMSIIALPEKRGEASIKQYVKLQLPYGMIVSNADTNSPPSYYLFSRNMRTILEARDVVVFLAELEKLPDGVTIDMISKCTVPFYIKNGVNIDEQYKQITALLERKRFKLVSSLEEDAKHASFCYCETGFIILDKPRHSEQEPAGDTLKTAPKQ
jgi:hypothetical protein